MATQAGAAAKMAPPVRIRAGGFYSHSLARVLRRAAGLAAFAIILCFQLANFPRPASAQAARSFSAVSIQRFKPGTRSIGRAVFAVDPAGVHALERSLTDLICKAYGIQPFQIVGGASWVRTERFNLDAATEMPANSEQQMLMLRQVLATRFGLRLATEAKMTRVFDLVVAKGGPKFHELGTGKWPRPPQAPPGEFNALQSQSLTALINNLNDLPRASAALGRIVVDRTGLTGRYGLWLTLPTDPIPGTDGFVTHFQDVPFALRQIGLDLKPDVAPVVTYKIQAAHPPTPN